MKKLVMVAILLFLAAMPLMGQTTSSTTTTPKPAANSSAKPTQKTEPKHVIYWDGTGRWESPERDARSRKSTTEGNNEWPSEIVMTPATPPTENSQESQAANHLLNSTSGTGALPSGQYERLHCVGPERRPCTEGVVRDLTQRMMERRDEHPLLASIHSVTLESREGEVSCQQHGGQPCTHEQVRALNEHVAEPLRCALYFSAARPSGEAYSTARQSRTATPSGTTTNHTPTASTGSTTQGTPTASTPTPDSTQSNSKTASNSSTPAGGTSTQSTPTGQNHAQAAGSRGTPWQYRTVAGQAHASSAGNHNSMPPKMQQ